MALFPGARASRVKLVRRCPTVFLPERRPLRLMGITVAVRQLGQVLGGRTHGRKQQHAGQAGHEAAATEILHTFDVGV